MASADLEQELSFSSPDHKSSPDLPAPPGWLKKVSSSKKGTPHVYFIAPDGEELKSKKAIDQYLKAHPGGPAASDFDWSTGETPTRRSSRLSSKVRPSPESGSAGKRARQKVEKIPPKEKDKKEEETEAEKVAGEADEIMEEADKVEAVGASEKEEDEKTEKVEDAKPETEEKTTEPDSSKAQEYDNNKKEVEVLSSENKEGVIKESLADEKDEPKEEKKEPELKESLEENTVAKEHSESKTEDAKEHSESKTEELKESVFQHCPEAPEASRQVDVST